MKEHDRSQIVLPLCTLQVDSVINAKESTGYSKENPLTNLNHGIAMNPSNVLVILA